MAFNDSIMAKRRTFRICRIGVFWHALRIGVKAGHSVHGLLPSMALAMARGGIAAAASSGGSV